MSREWRFYIQDMIEFSEKALKYTEGMNQQEFVENSLIYDATLRNIELIGEAASNIPQEIRETYPKIPWRLVIATRNRIIHAYLGLEKDIPELLINLRNLSKT